MSGLSATERCERDARNVVLRVAKSNKKVISATPNQAFELFYIFADPYFDISFSSSRRLKEMYAEPSTPSVPANR
jgi:hypothetical protein